ncbi:TetR/AcrR family transcriptional regulator [Microbacterium sp. H1-D42]|uniref:TetR/AcrR family transcriptional regulator n=1 Tax=Microbacterium sp. H1-D42 TaxID=2925844 RepID=UPI001F534C40|nr:TetR/AcrR family transcriptional regulator [Microbacterium sp. H1-D42]UNK71490.1 TetR/AcrR family transcriptional regulator [Microbacterium sp. H1-D42]
MSATEDSPPDWRDFSGDPLSPLLRSATQTFVARGYHGTTTRMLAAAAGMSVPGLYHHFASKQALIVAIMDAAMIELRERSLGALTEAGDDAGAQLDLHIECLALFHAHRRELALLASTELRSLDPTERDHHIAARDAQERMLVDILQRGVDQGVFTVDDARQLARALATMSTGISQWYSPAGPLTPADIAASYIAYARRLTS